MNDPRRRETSLLSDIVRAVRRCETIDDALAAIVDGLRTQFPLWRASILQFGFRAQSVHVSAVWCAGETFLAAGTDIEIVMSPAVRSTVESLLLGRPVALKDHGLDFGLIGDVFRDEGLASWVGIPLQSGGMTTGVLSIASSSPLAFQTPDVLLLQGIAAGIEAWVAELTTRSFH